VFTHEFEYLIFRIRYTKRHGLKRHGCERRR
jgi:hypothetical protein